MLPLPVATELQLELSGAEGIFYIMSSELFFALPEITLFSLACILLLVGSFSKHTTDGGICAVRARILGLYSLLGVLFLLVVSFDYDGSRVLAFGGSYLYAPVTSVLKMAVCFLAIISFISSGEYFRKHGMVRGEYYVLGMFSVLGMLVMISANTLLTVYLGLELMSLCLYAMVAMNRNSLSGTEAGMKYFILGAIASGMLLYGMSILYGATATLHLDEILQIAVVYPEKQDWLHYGTLFILAGLSFKIGAVPFHAWLPDVYQGARTAVTVFIASAPKIAVFAIFVHLLSGLSPLIFDWRPVLITLAILSMSIGNILAILQRNIKRMLAWSAIANAGFILMGILVGTSSGFAASMFYVIVYALMNVIAFSMLILLGSRGHTEFSAIADLNGLAHRSPWFALLFLFVMLSMAGIPPFAGFWMKWFVLYEVVQANFVWLAVIAVLTSVIGAFYYLRVIRVMYFEQLKVLGFPLDASVLLRWVLSISSLSLLLIGLFPNVLMMVCKQVMVY